MAKKINPFRPASPVFRGVFAGRTHEIKCIEKALVETRDGNPKNLLIVGERGVGKTSLLLYFNYLAKGELSIENLQINNLLERELRTTGSTSQKLKDIWAFMQRLEIAGSKIAPRQALSDAEIYDNLICSIADTVDLIRTGNNRCDGLVILIDEADNAPQELDLGSLLKQISERLILENRNNVLLAVAGLPEIRKILSDSHPSSLRIFEELELLPLSEEDVKRVIHLGLEQANQKNQEKVTITEEALNCIVRYSEGYPHFVQQFGYSSFDYDFDSIIDEDDVTKAALSPGGAFDLIGDRYYKTLYFKIKEESYRQVLKIMSSKGNRWVAKKEIRSKFKGKQSTLDNAISTLLEKKIILRRPDKIGEYRLQWAGFALWINIFAETPESSIKKYNGSQKDRDVEGSH
jgi:hypothetical protein